MTRYGETRVAGFGTAVFALGEAFLVVPGLVPVLVGKVLIGGGR